VLNSRLDLSRISDELRYRILDYVLSKGVTHRDLGIDRTYLFKLKKRSVRVSDNILRRLLKHVSEEELERLLGDVELEALGIIRDGVINYGIVIKILNKAKEDPYLKSLLIKWASENLAQELPHIVRVKEEHIKKFERLLSSKSRKTREDRLRYLKRALDDLEWELSPEKLEEYILELQEESANTAQHIAKALKLFIKTVLKDPKLYHSFKVPQPSEKVVAEPITLKQVVEVAKRIEHIGAKTFFILLAETGLRPCEILNLSINDVDLNKRRIVVARVTQTKRAYITFLHEKTAKFISDAYIPFRTTFISKVESALRNLGYGEHYISEWKRKFLPFKDYELRQEIYRAMDEALGKRFRIYDLRSFFSAYMIKQGVSPLIVNILQGRVAPREFKILQQRYLPFSEEDLREVYEEKAPCITCVM